ncbi:MAG: histidine phosphatase family protein [Dehalococcoidia bacterium]
MATSVVLVRHGQTRSNATGFVMGWSEEDLDDTGYAQVRKLAYRMAALPVSSIYSSPLRRTLATASIIAEPHGLEPRVLEDLIENNLGDWQGLHEDDIWRGWPELRKQSMIDPSDITMPNGESFRQVTERAVRAFEMVLSANEGGQPVIVTHDVIVRVLVAHVLGVTNSIYRRLMINNASLSVIRVADGKSTLVTLNDVSHLEG